MRAPVLALLLLAGALAGCTAPPQAPDLYPGVRRGCDAPRAAPEGQPLQEPVTFATGDGVEVHGILWKGQSAHAAVFVHGLNEDQRSWAIPSHHLWQRGFTVLTFDLRGHGASRERGGQPYELANFTEHDLAQVEADVALAAELLRGRFAPACIALVGASLGANAAMRAAAAARPGVVDAVAMLSPALEYRGVRADDAVRAWGERPLLLLAAEGDAASARDARALAALAGAPTLEVVAGDAHGTALVAREGPQQDRLFAWLLAAA